MENKIYIALYDEDAFSGIEVPKELESVIKDIFDNTENIIDEIFTNYKEYRDHEVWYSSYAKDGSNGTTKINNINELAKFLRDDAVYDIIKPHLV